MAAREAYELYAHVHRRNTYLACEDLDTTWDLAEVLKFDQLWNKGHDIEYIAEYFRRHVDEVAILVIDRANLGRIEPREGGVFGCLTR